MMDFQCPACGKIFPLAIVVLMTSAEHIVSCPHCKARWRVGIVVVRLVD